MNINVHASGFLEKTIIVSMRQTILFIMMLSLLSCVKENSNFEEVDFISMETELKCFLCRPQDCIDDCEFVINDSCSYVLLDSLKLHSENCNSVQLPEIDFNEYTLLGKGTYVAACAEADFSGKVEKNESDKKYIYTIEIDTSGHAHCFYGSMNWILVPKISSDYSIEFDVILK